MRTILLTAAIFVVALSIPAGAAGRTDVPREPGPNPWTHLDFNNAPETFQFAIVSDRTGGMRPGVFAEAVEKLNLLQPEFVLCIGDLVEGGAQDSEELDRQWDEFDAIIADLAVPFFYVAGNHDVSNSESGREVWQRRHGRLYYHFTYNDVLFLCLHSEENGSASLGTEQVEYVVRVLADHPSPRWTFVFLHKPLWTYSNETNWEEVEELLVNRPHTVFTGHTHEYLKYNRHGRDYFVLGTTGGGMAHEGPVAGEFDHVVWVTMTQDAPRFANLVLEGIKDKDARSDVMATLAAPALDGEAVTSEPLIVDGGTFEGGIAHLYLRNLTDIPLKIRGTLVPNAHLRPSPSVVDRVLPARVEEAVDVRLDVAGPVAVRELLPLVTHWNLTYEPPEHRPIDIPITHRILVDTPFACPRADTSITVDGALDDWPGLPFPCIEPAQVSPSALEWNGAGDCSFRFATAYDDENVYIAVETTDDRAFLDTHRRAGKQDGIELRFDARAAGIRNDERAQDEKRQARYQWIVIAPGEDGSPPTVLLPDSLAEGIRLAAVRTRQGHVCEVAIPVAYLEDLQEGQWTGFRLNATVIDYDSPRDVGTSLWWRPHWASTANWPASGTFLREE